MNSRRFLYNHIWLLPWLALSLPFIVVSVWGVTTWQARRSEIADQLLTLDRLQAVANFKPKLATLETAAPEAENKPLLPEGKTKAVLVAEMLDKLKASASAAGLQLLSANALPDLADDPLVFIGGSLQFTGTLQGFLQFLDDTRLHTPQVFVVSYKITGTGADSPETGTEMPMSFEISVYSAIDSNISPKEKAK